MFTFVILEQQSYNKLRTYLVNKNEIKSEKMSFFHEKLVF